MRDERPTILISAVSGDIGYSVVQSLREKVSKIVGCDLKPYTPVRHLLDRFHVVPPATQRSAYLQAIRTILREEHLQYFIPISEPEISLLNHEREEFDGLGVKLLLNHSWVLDRFLDKMKTMSFLQGIGIQVPKTAFLRGYDGRFGFPIIVKQQAGYGSRKLWIADSLAELEYIKGKVEGSYIVQEYIGTPEEEYTTGVFSDGQKTSSISFKRRLGADGTTLEAVLVK